MLSIVTEQNPAFSLYAAKALDVDGFGPHATIAVSDGQRIIAVVVYSKYDQYQCEVAIVTVSPTWASRRIMNILFGYPFIQLGCSRITTIIRADNLKSISLAERLGFVRETAETGLRQYCRDGTNAHIYGLLKSECRWIKETDGQRLEENAAA